MSAPYLSKHYVEETRFGLWFLRSHTWQHHVLRVAINDLRSLFTEPLPEAPVLLDAGCGQGKSFTYLQQVFAPERLIGLDADPHSLEQSKAEAARQGRESVYSVRPQGFATVREFIDSFWDVALSRLAELAASKKGAH